MEIRITHIAFVLLLPILGALTTFVFGNKRNSGWVASGFSGLVFFFSIFLSISFSERSYLSFDWFQVGQFSFQFGFLIDKLSVLMLVVVSLITLLVNIFSIEYMKNDEGKKRYFTFLGVFAFSMYGIVLSSNLFMTFFFWELVGFSSYLLIGFWYQQKEPPKASLKAFMINRVGDAGFLVALFVLFAYFKTFELPILYDLFSKPLTIDLPLTLLGLGLFLGAVGKSAQFPLQTWLPDAMAGPTPVSALIHAATMVAAGVFMLIRVFPMLSEQVLEIIAITGGITAFMGAFAAFAQNDIKKVLAFSTISQLGYMMIAIGSQNPYAAFFHLTTHAFFKASLFLCAGSIIHVLHRQFHDNDFDVQDMTNMGGLKSKMPYTFVAYTISMLALCGLPLFSGFFSKEAIILSSMNVVDSGSSMTQRVVPFLAISSVFMTATYMGRQYFMVFFGKMEKEPSSSNWFESKLLVIPILLLSGLSLWFWYGINPIGVGGDWIMNDLLVYQVNESQSHEWWITLLSIGLAILGLLIAYLIHSKGKTQVLDIIPDSVSKLSLNHWYLDQAQYLMVVKPVLNFSKLSERFDRNIVDGFVNGFGILNVTFAHLLGWFDQYIVDGLVNFLAYISSWVGNLARRVQGGRIQNYFVWAVVGILLIYIFVF